MNIFKTSLLFNQATEAMSTKSSSPMAMKSEVSGTSFPNHIQTPPDFILLCLLLKLQADSYSPTKCLALATDAHNAMILEPTVWFGITWQRDAAWKLARKW